MPTTHTSTSRPTATRTEPEGEAHGATDSRPAPSRRRKVLAAAAFAAPVVGAAVIGSRVGPQDPATGRWYRRLAKPPFQPPAAAFAPVWTVLYTGIATSGYRVWAAPDHQLRAPALALWGVQMAANAAFQPVFFGARRPRAALAVVAATFASTAAYTAMAARVDKPAAALMAPYLAWTGFAGALNEEIVRRNPDA